MKTNKNFITAVIFTLILAISHVALAQTYHIKSFDGKIAEVKLNYKMFSKKLAVSCSTDTLYLLDYTGTRKTRIIDQRFIQIEYGVLGGTGIINRNTLILSINRNKIITSLLVNSHFEGFSLDKHVYHDVKFKCKPGLGKSYQIVARVIDEVKSKKNPSLNVTSSKEVNLRFDLNYNVFYSNVEYLSQSFKIFKPEDVDNFTEKVIKDGKPEILLGKVLPNLARVCSAGQKRKGVLVSRV